MAKLPPPIPDWLKPTLKRVITGQRAPDTMDFQIVSAALAGVEIEALKTKFEVASEEILKSLMRVACAVRSGKVDGKAFELYPDLAALKRQKPKARRAERSATETALAVIEDDSSLPQIIPGDDKSFHDFLMAAKVQHARRLVPDTFRKLQKNIASFDGTVSNAAVSKSLEMFYGVGRRGPGVAMQFNVGGPGESGKGEPKTPHFFEATILSAEKEEGAGGGETTMFDERLLGQQEEMGQEPK